MKLLDILKIVLGIILLIIGIIGGIIPIFQGWIFGIAGLTLLSKYSKFIKKYLEKVKRKFNINHNNS
tara:strand:- start:667 stop:867 length:201 start_codon:yes stop_codon:yes gene_type:complete